MSRTSPYSWGVWWGLGTYFHLQSLTTNLQHLDTTTHANNPPTSSSAVVGNASTVITPVPLTGTPQWPPRPGITTHRGNSSPRKSLVPPYVPGVVSPLHWPRRFPPSATASPAAR
ncbi:hypothetical protein GWK47_027353 [Chionoecetes opilio]|uniref:Uncharacterized protein n=1 Tax=Chionoecetes opilio TaxID=41210 RepID=A0A8J8WDK0_CHIOP|nr:hypothetical protein GWK47_027353 [Chionoecetes opilio]